MRARTLAALAAATLLFTGCGSTEPTGDAQQPAADKAATLTVTDPWVKATKEGEMTGAFGKFTNDGDTDVTIVKATSAASPMLELHEVVMADDGTMKMQPKEGGFVVPAGKSLTLEPGGLHIMFMGVAQDLNPGDEVTVTLEYSDGATQEIRALVKNFTGANEKYAGKDKKKDKKAMH
ncbi:MAG TPA: copper chaperone PCu(A)C [Marmoricola sp.]|nr:copper chaperone PCu(A)C [Marmoricola sp.]